MKRLLAALAVFFLAAPLLLSGPAAAAPAPAWTVDKAASKIAFTSSFGGQKFDGGFARWDAAIRFDPNNLAGSSAVVTIDTASAFSGDKDRDASLKEPNWFSAKAFPKAVYKTTGFKSLGGGKYQAAGTLTLRGQTKPLTLPFTLVITGNQAKMTARVTVNRLAFGVGQNEWKKTDVIPDPVTVTIAVSAKK